VKFPSQEVKGQDQYVIDS